MTETEEILKLRQEIKNLKEENAAQQQMFEMTTLHLQRIQAELQSAKMHAEAVNQKFLDSISYARRILDSFVLDQSKLQLVFPNSFIFDKPLEIVGGDFIWSYESNGYVYLAVGDCSGHGVPGAMLSVFVVSMLNQIFKLIKSDTPAGVLLNLHDIMMQYLNKYEEATYDSVEIAIVRIDKARRQVLFSGINRPLLLVKSEQLETYKGVKFVLGDSSYDPSSLKDIRVDLQQKDFFYLYSDGFTDQFGGVDDKKFSTKRLKSLIEKISREDIACQRQILADTFSKWKGERDQIDDVIFLGIQI